MNKLEAVLTGFILIFMYYPCCVFMTVLDLLVLCIRYNELPWAREFKALWEHNTEATYTYWLWIKEKWNE